VVEDRAEVLQVVARQADAYRLRERIAKCIRMTVTFTLHDLERQIVR